MSKSKKQTFPFPATIDVKQHKHKADMKEGAFVGVNLKNIAAKGKATTHCIPAVAIFALGAAMQNGGDKYGPFNFRDADVTASIFHDALQRHEWDWWDSEDFATDSMVHHLGHLMAGCAIVLDAIHQGNFVDDRPKNKSKVPPSRGQQTWSAAK